MRPSLLLSFAGAAGVVLAAASVFLTAAAQAPSGTQDAAGNAPAQARTYPAPANLKVLPREMTGQQVHDLMEQWKAGLGMGCATCHAEDKQKQDPDGHPLLNFASDAKPEKEVARLMYTMTEEINRKYIARIDGSGVPVTCGTCHRGHIGPEPFASSPKARPSIPVDPRAQQQIPPEQQDLARPAFNLTPADHISGALQSGMR